MKIAITSDWHVMSERHHPHTTSKELLQTFLNWGEQELDHIVLAGDIFELIKDSWKYVARSNPEIVSSIQRMRESGKVSYIVGNHDEQMAKIWGIGDRVVVPGTDILAIHGHQFDPMSHGVGKYMSHFSARATCLMEDLGWRNCSKHMLTLGYKLGFKRIAGDPRKKVGLDVYYEPAKKVIANTPGINRLVHGHTHRPYIGDGIVMNCGGNTIGYSDYMLVTDGVCELRTMENDFS